MLRLALNSWWMSPSQVAAVARRHPTNPEAWYYLSVRCQWETSQLGHMEPPPTESETAQLRAYYLGVAEHAARRATELDADATPFMRAGHRAQLASALGQRGDHAGACAVLRKALDEASTSTYPWRDTNVASMHVALARNLRALGEWSDAEQEAVLALQSMAWRPESPSAEGRRREAEDIVRDCEMHGASVAPD